MDGTNGFPVVETLRRDVWRTDVALQEKPEESWEEQPYHPINNGGMKEPLLLLRPPLLLFSRLLWPRLRTVYSRSANVEELSETPRIHGRKLVRGARGNPRSMAAHFTNMPTNRMMSLLPGFERLTYYQRLHYLLVPLCHYDGPKHCTWHVTSHKVYRFLQAEYSPPPETNRTGNRRRHNSMVVAKGSQVMEKMVDSNDETTTATRSP
jgi:hypothetical protein